MSYSFRQVTNYWYVIESESGCSLLYRTKPENDLIPDYKQDAFNEWHELPRRERKRMFKAGKSISISDLNVAKEALKKASISMNYIPISPLSLDQQQETKMYDTQKDPTLNYLQRRLQDIRHEHQEVLNNHFQIHGIRPKSAKEMREWLKSGNYRIELPKSLDEEDENSFYWSEVFQWGKTGPDSKAWNKGYDKLSESYKSTLDTITIVTDEAARLKALEDFKGMKFH